jgi:TPR repeat protein
MLHKFPVWLGGGEAPTHATALLEHADVEHRRRLETRGLMGDPEAQVQMAWLAAADGSHLAEARMWLEMAAAAGHAEAQFELGCYGLEAHPVATEGWTQGLEWLERAGTQDHRKAQLLLGFLHDANQGVPPDARVSRYWYERAAEQGCARAALNLGIAWQFGRWRGSQSSVQAVLWYEMAAGLAEAPAMANLGLLHLLGDGVQQDAVEAFPWLSSAVGLGMQAYRPVMEYCHFQVLHDLPSPPEPGVKSAFEGMYVREPLPPSIAGHGWLLGCSEGTPHFAGYTSYLRQ